MKRMHTTTRFYDAAGIGNIRMLRIVLMWKLMGLDGLARNPRLSDLVTLTTRHYLGGYMAVISVKYEREWMKFLRAFRQRRALLLRRAGLVRDKLLGRL